MKKDVLCMQHLKQLLSKARKAGGSVEFHQSEDPMELLLWSILTNYASEARATAAMAKLQAAMVDYNELRATPTAEIVEIIGVDYPLCRMAAEEISCTLHGLFNRLHHLSLDFLKAGSRRTAESFLNALDGVSPHAKAMMTLRCLRGHAVPLDVNMYAVLLKGGCIPAGMPVEQAQRWLASRIKERDVVTFYGAVKRYAAAHAPRKLIIAKPPMAMTAKTGPTVAETAPHGDSTPAGKSGASRKQAPQKKPKPGEPLKTKRVRKQRADTARSTQPSRKPSRKSGVKPG